MARQYGFAVLQRIFKASLAAVVALGIASAAFGQSNLGEIAGTAVVEGKPLNNITVRLRNVDNGALVGSGFTNDGGELRFTGLPVGNYVVETVAPNGNILGTSGRMSPTAGSASARGLIITVVAVGAGVSGVANHGAAAGAGAAGAGAAGAGAAGAGAAGAGAAAAGGAFLATTAGIAATPGDSTEVASIEKPSGIANRGEIAGTAVVEGKPLNNITVRLRNVDSGALVGSGLTNAGGELRFTGLPVGNYVVETVAPNGTLLGTSERISLVAGAMVATGVSVTTSAAAAAAVGVGGAGTPAQKPLAVFGGGDPINPGARAPGFPGRGTDFPGSVMIPSLPRPDMGLGRGPAGPAAPSLPRAGGR